MSNAAADECKGIGLSGRSQAWSDLEMISFPLKTWTEDDVEIAITHCGVCGTDVHTLTGTFGPVKPPLVVGHEIVGIATKVGANVKDIKVGDRVGLGAACGCCRECALCKQGDENYCADLLWTYNCYYPDGIKTMGGYSTTIRAHQQFIFPIPLQLDSAEASSMLCAGLSVFSPMKRYNIKSGSKLGVIGIGGLGHYAVLLGKALGAEVTAFSHSPNKEAEVRKMGADHFVLPNPGFERNWKRYFDLLICTIDVTTGFPLAEYMSTLYPFSSFVMVGLPDEPMPALRATDVGHSAVNLTGSNIGSKKEVGEMLDLAVKYDIKPWIQKMPMSKAAEALELVRAGKARYRIVLEQDLENLPVMEIF